MSTLTNIIDNGNNYTYVHRQSNIQTLQMVEDIKNSTDRGMIRNPNPDAFQGQHIAEIPILEFLRITSLHPELATDDRALWRWLMSDEGADFRIASGQKTRSANIIIK